VLLALAALAQPSYLALHFGATLHFDALDAAGVRMSMSMRTSPCLAFIAFAVAACNVYDSTLLEGPLNRGGSAGASNNSGGSSGNAGGAGGNATGGAAGGGAAGEGGNAGTGGNGGSGATGGTLGTGGSGASGTGGAGGTSGTGGTAGTRLDASADAPADASPDVGRDASSEAIADVAAEVRDAVPDIQMRDPDAPPCAGTALSLDGTTNYAMILRPVQDDFTLEALIKTSASLSGTLAYEGRGLFFADVGGGNNDFGVSILNGRLAFGVGNPPGSDLIVSSVSMVITNQWTHVAVTRTKATGGFQVLVNGVVEGEMATSPQVNSLTAATMMMIGSAGGGQLFQGQLDEVRIWNIARSGTDIAATMRQRLVGNETGLVRYWRLDDGSGSLAADSSISNVSALFNGTVTWVPSDSLCSF
jgi:hypothetical protein